MAFIVAVSDGGSAAVGANLESEQHFVLVGQIADHAAQRRRQLLDERRRCENAIGFRDLGLLQHVDDLERVLSAEILLANATEIRDSQFGSRARAGDVKLQNERGQPSGAIGGI